METRQSSLCNGRFLVSLVSNAFSPQFNDMTDRPSDIAYYGINLNQSIILARIGYAKGATPFQTLYNTAIGNIIVQAAVSLHVSHSPIQC